MIEPAEHVATVTGFDNAGHIRVLCPHCSSTHTHNRGTTGSRVAVAGCSTGFRGYREYQVKP